MPDQTPPSERDAIKADLGERPAVQLDDPSGAVTPGDADPAGADELTPPPATRGSDAMQAVPTPDESEDFGDPRASLAAREDAAAVPNIDQHPSS